MKIIGLDIGIRSIGWALQEDGEIIAKGIRIPRSVEDAQTKESLAAHRGAARRIRRTLYRRKARLSLLKRLICNEFGLNLADYHAKDGDLPKAFVADENTKSPYELRVKALEHKLNADEFARVILHIAKHRGYGNKHARKESDKDKGAVLSALKNNEKALTAYKSVGEYLYKEFYQKGRFITTKDENGKEVLERDEAHFGKVRNTTDVYEQCMRQEWLQAELELIFEKQRELGFKFSDEFKNKVLEIAFFQRPLKDTDDKVGFCTFFPDEKRAPKDSLSAIEYVALGKIINELKYIEKKWKKETGEELKGKICAPQNINDILKIVIEKGEISYKEFRSILKLDERVKIFSKNVKLDYTQKTIDEAEKAKFLELKATKDNLNIPNLKGFQNALKGSFEKFDRKTLDDIAFDLATINDKEKLFKELDKYDLSAEQKEALSNLSFSKFLNLSYKALNEIIPLMKDGLRYDEAVEKLGFKPSDEYDYDKVQKELHNPVVSHILAEVVKVLKAILKKHGQVHKINIEFTREAGISKEKRNKLENKQKSNFQANEKAKEMCNTLGIVASHKNILKIKLWKEQGGACVYSCNNGKGKTITEKDLQDETTLQIDHIYPYSRSFDDSYSNKVLVFTEQNQIKRERTPFEAFGSNTNKWNNIVSFVNGCKTMSESKKKRILNTEFKEREQGFIQRNLVDTSYIANVVRDYIDKNVKFLPLDEKELAQSTMFFELDSYNEKDDSKKAYKRKHIEIISGNLTSMMKHYWGLHFLDKKNEFGEYEKDRNHHLHHALDAIIISYMNASRVKAFADFKKNLETMKASEYAEKLSEIEKEQKRTKRKKSTFEVPSNYANRDEFERKIKEQIFGIFVSQPPNKKARGALHLDSFYSQSDTSVISSKDTMENALELGKVRKIGTKIVSNASMVRLDIFKRKKDDKFFGVPIYTMDFAKGVLPNKAVGSKEWIEMDSNYEFLFSIFSNDLLYVKKKGMEKAELCYYVKFDIGGGQISFKSHDNRLKSLTENQIKLYGTKDPTEERVRGRVGIQNLEIFEKWQVSPLGEVKKAEFKEREPIALKSTPKNSKLDKLNSKTERK